jgi:hypothetical protein
MGIIVDRSSCRKYGTLRLPAIPSIDVFGLQLPFSIISLTTLIARLDEGCRIPGAGILGACGFPSAYREPLSRTVPLQEPEETDDEWKDEMDAECRIVDYRYKRTAGENESGFCFSGKLTKKSTRIGSVFSITYIMGADAPMPHMGWTPPPPKGRPRGGSEKVFRKYQHGRNFIFSA